MVGIGIIGGGMMSQVGHLPFYLRDPRCSVVGVAEARPSLVEALRHHHGVGRIAPHHRELLDDPAVDAVVISAPRPATATITLEALEAGKHVLAEKPMALTSEDARRLVDAARARSLIYAVGFMKRYDPGVLAAHDALRDISKSRRLGRLLLARFYNFTTNYAVPLPPHTRPAESRTERFAEGMLWPDWLDERHRGAYGWILNAASHNVNLIHYLCEGEVSVSSATCAGEEAVAAVLDVSGVPILLEVAKSEIGVWREGAEFLFEKGRLDLEIPSPMDVDSVGRVAIEDRSRPDQSEVLETGKGWSFALQARGFIDALEGTEAPRTTGEEGFRDMLLNDRIWRAVAGNEQERKTP